jgi:Response regulator containing CheY-like receiver, AAA-type ATPase, and DNA-binding domains
MGENLSILVVDDYQPLVTSLAEVLNREGFEVKTANSAAEALEIVEDYPVDIMLTDIMMPHMNGVELYRETKKINPSLTAVLMTAYSAEGLIQEGVKEGITAVVDKPVDIKFLLALFGTITRIKPKVT